MQQHSAVGAEMQKHSNAATEKPHKVVPSLASHLGGERAGQFLIKAKSASLYMQALYGGGLKYAKALDLLGPGWIVELDKNASNSMGSALAGWRFGL